MHFCMFFPNFCIIAFPKFVNMIKNTPLSPIFHVFAPLNDVRNAHVHCLVLKNNPNYMSFFTRMISNFKYKCPPPGSASIEAIFFKDVWNQMKYLNQ